jgi:hypothetical protein
MLPLPEPPHPLYELEQRPMFVPMPPWEWVPLEIASINAPKLSNSTSARASGRAPALRPSMMAPADAERRRLRMDFMVPTVNPTG